MRRYITRTHAIYGLQMKDYVRLEGDEPKVLPARPTQVTPRNSVAGIAPEGESFTAYTNLQVSNPTLAQCEFEDHANKYE